MTHAETHDMLETTGHKWRAGGVTRGLMVRLFGSWPGSGYGAWGHGKTPELIVWGHGTALGAMAVVMVQLFGSW